MGVHRKVVRIKLRSALFFIQPCSQAPSLKFPRSCEIHDVTKYDVETRLIGKIIAVEISSKTTLTIMSILQVTHESPHNNLFKTFRTRSQQINLKSSKVENTQVPTCIYGNCSLSIKTSINLLTLSSSATVE